MGHLRAKLDEQEKKLQTVSKAGDQAWDMLNQELRELRDKLKTVKNDSRTRFKDAAITHGDFGNRITALEAEVANLKAKLDK